MKKIQLILLVVIVAGLGLLASKNYWLPILTGSIVSHESKEWIDTYFSKDYEHVFYASFDSKGPNSPINITYKTLAGADPGTFKAVSKTTVEKNSTQYLEYTYYSDKANTYKYEISKTSAGVSTSVTTTSPRQ